MSSLLPLGDVILALKRWGSGVKRIIVEKIGGGGGRKEFIEGIIKKIEA